MYTYNIIIAIKNTAESWKSLIHVSPSLIDT